MAFRKPALPFKAFLGYAFTLYLQKGTNLESIQLLAFQMSTGPHQNASMPKSKCPVVQCRVRDASQYMGASQNYGYFGLPTIMENQMEKEMENEMEIGII